MKSALALAVGLTLSATAISDNKPTYTEEAWNQMLKFSEQSQEEMDGHLHDHGITGHNLEPLRVYTKQIDKDKTEAGEHLRKQMCAHRSKYENDSEATAKFFEKWDAQEHRYMEKAVDGLDVLLGESDSAAFKVFVNEHVVTSGQQHTFQIMAENVRNNPAITREVVEGTCTEPKPPSGLEVQ